MMYFDVLDLFTRKVYSLFDFLHLENKTIKSQLGVVNKKPRNLLLSIIVKNPEYGKGKFTSILFKIIHSVMPASFYVSYNIKCCHCEKYSYLQVPTYTQFIGRL